MQDYPVLKIIQEKVKGLNKSIPWLMGEINRSESWFWKIKSIADIQLGVLVDISKAIDFDLVIDFYQWQKGSVDERFLIEPALDYKSAKKLSLQITVTGKQDELLANIAGIINNMQKDAEKHGLNIE